MNQKILNKCRGARAVLGTVSSVITKVAMVAACAILGTVNSRAFVRMSPQSYLGARIQSPYVSPFRPYFDPQPMLDFQPLAQPQNKPALKTSDDVWRWGYYIYQKRAHKVITDDMYSPETGAYMGQSIYSWLWDSSYGWRQVVENWDGTSTDSGWTWDSTYRWPSEKNGMSHEYWERTFNSNGFYAERETENQGVWYLMNWANFAQPNFEIAVNYSLQFWPDSMNLQDAYASQSVEYLGTWQIFGVPPGTESDITPYWAPENYKLQAIGLIWDLKSLADAGYDHYWWQEGG